MGKDLTKGPVIPGLMAFALPMILGNLLQQCYNIADTLIVGRYLGKNALAAVGSSFTLMTFLTSILLGLCMGSGALISQKYGEKDTPGLRQRLTGSFWLIAGVTLALNILVYLLLDSVKTFLQVPQEAWTPMREYLAVIYAGIFATFLYNYFASMLRAVGNSAAPLVFLAISAVLNIALDLLFVVTWNRGCAGAAEATVIAQYVSGVGLTLYTYLAVPELRIRRVGKITCLGEVARFSALTCVQQSVMNLGILLVQGRVNHFGSAVMAAFAAGVKIDAFAYMPVQDFGNAFSAFAAQNYGARQSERIRSGFRGALAWSGGFCLMISALVWIFARRLIGIFVLPQETEILAVGVQYLRTEGAFYIGIGWLFLLYGIYRGLGKPGMSVVLTVISLGLRVILAYALSAIPALGVAGIWWSVPIGWAAADLVGLLYYRQKKSALLPARKE